MAIKDEKRKSNLDKVKESLYDKYADIHPKKRSEFHASTVRSNDDWDDADLVMKKQFRKRKPTRSTSKKKLHWVKKIFLASLGFFVLAAIFAGLKMFNGGNTFSTDAIDISILTQPFVDGGEDLPVTIQIVNNNPTQIETADIVFSYPTTSFSDGSIERNRVALGTVRSGQTVFQDFDIRLFGEEGEERILTAMIEYRVQGSNAIVQKTVEEMVTIRSTPIEVLVEGRDSGIPNQQYTFDIIINSNATQVTNNVIAQVEYPQGFDFTVAEPVPSFDVDTWVLGDIEPGSSRVISVTGTLAGATGDNKVFRVFVGEQDIRQEQDIATIYGSQVQQVSLSPSFINANLLVQGNSGNRIIIPAAQDSRVSVAWQNTLPVQLQNVTLEAEISGNAYTVNGISNTDGFFDSNTNTITWDPVNNNELASVGPGEQGTFKFDIQPRPLAAGNGQVITQPMITIVLRASGIDGLGQAQQAETISSVQLVVNSDVRLESKTLYYGGPFTNIGPMPPAVEETTEYTLTWHMTNSSSNLRNGTVTTRLPSYVEWLDITTPASEALVYNSATRELVWNIGNIDAGAGFTNPAREVSFKVSITPSASQQGQRPPLTESLVFSAEDTYTGGTVRVVRNPHTTRLLNDINLNSGFVE